MAGILPNAPCGGGAKNAPADRCLPATPPAPAKAAQEPEEEREEEPEKKQAVDQNLEEGDWPVTISGDALIYWHELVKRLTIGGVARMIAEHSVPLSFALPNVALLLSSQHDMLLSDAQVVNLARGLSEVCDQKVNLTVEVGNVGEETPSVYRARLAHERQISAEQSLQQDETVKRLLADFGGSIDEVKPA